MATMQYNYPVGLILSYDIYSDIPLISRNERSPYKNIRDPIQVDRWWYKIYVYGRLCLFLTKAMDETFYKDTHVLTARIEITVKGEV